MLVGDIEPARPGGPAELAVEDEEADQPEPEDRHRIADQADEADRLVRPAPLVDRGGDAGRDCRRGRRSAWRSWRAPASPGRRGRCPRSPGRAVSSDLPKFAGEHVADIDRELRRAAACRGRAPARAASSCACRGALAEDGEHRIDRDDAADQEGDEEQAEEGDEEAERRLRDAPGDAAGAPCPPHGHGAGQRLPRRMLSLRGRALRRARTSAAAKSAPVAGPGADVSRRLLRHRPVIGRADGARRSRSPATFLPHADLLDFLEHADERRVLLAIALHLLVHRRRLSVSCSDTAASTMALVSSAG